MATLEKLVRAFEAVKVSQGVGNGGKGGGGGGGRVGTSGMSNAGLKVGLADRPMEHTSAMASLAATISQQGQGLLSKRDLVLNSRDKVAHCDVIGDALVGAKSGDIQKMLTVGMETLLLLLDDDDPDVRMNADEALNRVVRGLSETHLGKIQVELYKEIKKNGPVRSLRAALNRFAVLCHHIRPQKCRAYVQNLLPCLIRMARRQEEPLLETLASSLDKILPTLGHFTNDNEIKNLLKAFLPNLSHSSAAVRRTAVTSLIALCRYSRKPSMFFLWLLNTTLQLLIPIQEDISVSLVLGCFLCIRMLLPHLVPLTCQPSPLDPSSRGVSNMNIENIVSVDQMLQVYELCIHYSGHKDHNIVTSSLEALQALLQSPPASLLMHITNPEGITRSRIFADPRASKLSSRAPSQISITPSLYDDEGSMMDFESSGGMHLEEGESAGGIKSSRESLGALRGECLSLEEEEEAGEVNKGERDAMDEVAAEAKEFTESVYSNLEIGPVEDCTLLFGRGEMDLSIVGSGTERDRRKTNESGPETKEQNPEVPERQGTFEKIHGNIGSFTDEDISLKYLVRYLCSSFLLSGHVGSVIPDKTIRVSVKVLALNCVAAASSLVPNVMGETLFIGAEGDIELQQHVDDVLRYHSHTDPQLGASVALLAGHFVQANLIHGGGQYFDLGRPALTLGALLDILCQLLGNESSVTVRGAVAGLRLCLPELLLSQNATAVAKTLPHLVRAANNQYWLVKVEVAELVSSLNLSCLDHIEASNTGPMNASIGRHKQFSHRVVPDVLMHLLIDQDQRVRAAAAAAIVRMIPELMSEGDLVMKIACKLVTSGHIRSSKAFVSSYQEPSRGLPSPPVPPFDKLLRGEGGKDWRDGSVSASLSRMVHLLTGLLVKTDNKYSMLGALEALAQLSEAYSPVLYPHAWSCQVHSSITHTSDGNLQVGLLTLILNVMSESVLSGDLAAQQNILVILGNLLSGIAMDATRSCEEAAMTQKHPWPMFSSVQMKAVADAVVEHVLRVLSIYVHIVEDVTPGTKPPIAPLAPQSALSPNKRKSRAETLGEKTRSSSPGKGEKTDGEDREKKVAKSGGLGNFSHLPEYIKLYDVVKNAYKIYRISLDDNTTDRLCGVLKAALLSLSRILEVASMNEFGRLADELLQYLKAVTVYLPTLTIHTGQQLLKCLFGSNISATWHLLSKSTSSVSTLSRQDRDSTCHQGYSLHHICLMRPFAELEKDIKQGAEGQVESDTIGSSLTQRKGSSNIFKMIGRNSDKSSLSSYIRLFEPLVIKALKLYTVSSDVVMQRAVLQLLIHLVQIRVNYCLLDSDQIFIGYVIKQFEYIEEGQIKCAEELIPAMFGFMVLLSYERYHSKSIIGVPKIMQLCDGLMASGQPPLSHCVGALQPLVEDLFLDRSTSGANDQKELDTQREVLSSMLLRLAHYHQVLQLLSLILKTTRDTNKERWRKLSRQVIDVTLPLLSRLQVNLDCEDSLASVAEVLNAVCPSVYRPVDCVLKALFTSPCELESTVSVERWIGCILLLIRVLITHSTQELVLARLEELGLSMEFVRNDTPGSGIDGSKENLASPQEGGKASSSAGTTFRDPLNVTQPETQPSVAMARFLLEVVRVSVAELQSVVMAALHSSHPPDFLHHLSYHILLVLAQLAQAGQWKEVTGAIKDICMNEPDLVEEINEALLFVAGRFPTLTLLWCQLMTSLDQTSQSLWTQVLRTSQRKSVTTLSPPANENSGPSSCLTLELLRRCGILLFANFVMRHMQEGEWLTWLVVQHISDVVMLHKEPPVASLLRTIHASSAASALLIQAIHARCNLIHKAEYGGHIVSLVAGVHVSQSGALVTLLVERLLGSPHLVVARAACSLATHRMHLLLAMPPPQVMTQMPSDDLTKILSNMKMKALDKKYGQLYSMLQRLLNQVHEKNHTATPGEQPIAPTSAKLDLNWYFQLVNNRCSIGEGGGGEECSRLLGPLEYSEIINIMSAKTFNTALLAHTLRYGLSTTLQANNNWGECNSSVETGDSEESSSSGSSSGGEAPLYTASKVVLLQHIGHIGSTVPRPHHVFIPGGGNKYSEKLSKMFSSADMSDAVLRLTPALLEYLMSFTRLPWRTDVHPDSMEHVLKFALLVMELLHWKIWQGNCSIETLCQSLQCVDLVLRSSSLAGLMGLPDRVSYVCSMVASIHATISYLLKPKFLPSVCASLSERLAGLDSSPLTACHRLVQLVVWLEAGGLAALPACVAHPVKNAICGLGRMPVVNSVVRTPTDLWSLGWSPEMAGDHGTTLPPLPVELLQETDVLKQFVFRVQLFGWTGRQQFEETWMAFLSVLNATPNEDTLPEELPYINLGLTLAVRGITALLVQTLLLPVPGNPHSGKLLRIPRDKAPQYMATKVGRKLRDVMSKLQDKLQQVNHLVKGYPHSSLLHLTSFPSSSTNPMSSQGSYRYQLGQVSVEYMVTALTAHDDPPESPENPSHNGCYEFEQRERQLASCGLDVQSCLHFLHYHFSSWLKPQSGLCASVIAEVVKSVACLCDLFTSTAHHEWVLDCLLPLHGSHPPEDHITTQYIILATSKALATLRLAKKDVSSVVSDGVARVVDTGLKSGQISVRTCALQGLLYLLQGPPEHSPPLINLAANYILKYYNDGKSQECESHEIAVWELWVYLVEHYESLPDPTLPSTALHMALSAAATTTTSPNILRQVLQGVERLVLVQQISNNTVEVILKLVMDLVLNGPPSVSLTALPLFITALYASVQTDPYGHQVGQDEMASDPETLLQVMEKMSIFFDRIRVGYPYEAEVIAGLVGQCILDVLPASQILNKVITEYISSHQPHPHLLASTLFQVFEGAVGESGEEGIVQEWVLLSLSNFTQRTPVALAVWCLTCFFIAASCNRWLRAAFPCVQARLGKLDARDRQIFCLAATHFRQSLAREEQRVKFDAVFQAVAIPGSPFHELLSCIEQQ
ncbi:huntingtin isoform X2 [Oratosquilla oratoria]|uniref:huntingtin isoform X2 n=1 Tax=Oratosquilla oratoria TaxID=337810 RepID=UPI003F75C027